MNSSYEIAKYHYGMAYECWLRLTVQMGRHFRPNITTEWLMQTVTQISHPPLLAQNQIVKKSFEFGENLNLKTFCLKSQKLPRLTKRNMNECFTKHTFQVWLEKFCYWFKKFQ